MIDGNGKPRTLTSGPTFVSSSLNSQRGTLQVGEIANYIASYKIKDSDVEGGRIENSILAIASSPENSGDVTDLSDNGIDTDDNTVDDPTITMITYVRKYFEIFNLVTPNGDGLNDYFDPQLVGYHDFEIKIYDRWGSLVYFSKDANHGWDGSHYTNNDLLENGTYMYNIYVLDYNNKPWLYNGEINLIR